MGVGKGPRVIDRMTESTEPHVSAGFQNLEKDPSGTTTAAWWMLPSMCKCNPWIDCDRLQEKCRALEPAQTRSPRFSRLCPLSMTPDIEHFQPVSIQASLVCRRPL